MFNSILERTNRIMGWRGYIKCLTPEVVAEVQRISDKAGMRGRVTDKEIAWLAGIEDEIWVELNTKEVEGD